MALVHGSGKGLEVSLGRGPILLCVISELAVIPNATATTKSKSGIEYVQAPAVDKQCQSLFAHCEDSGASDKSDDSHRLEKLYLDTINSMPFDYETNGAGMSDHEKFEVLNCLREFLLLLLDQPQMKKFSHKADY